MDPDLHARTDQSDAERSIRHTTRPTEAGVQSRPERDGCRRNLTLVKSLEPNARPSSRAAVLSPKVSAKRTPTPGRGPTEDAIAKPGVAGESSISDALDEGRTGPRRAQVPIRQQRRYGRASVRFAFRARWRPYTPRLQALVLAGYTLAQGATGRAGGRREQRESSADRPPPWLPHLPPQGGRLGADTVLNRRVTSDTTNVRPAHLMGAACPEAARGSLHPLFPRNVRLSCSSSPPGSCRPGRSGAVPGVSDKALRIAPDQSTSSSRRRTAVSSSGTSSLTVAVRIACDVSK